MIPRASRERPPLAPQVGVIALVPQQWEGPWMSRHNIMSRLARYFHVVWVDPARHWREVLGGPPPRFNDPFPAAAGFHRYQPPRWLPEIFRPPWLNRLSARTRLNQALGVLRKQGCRTILLYVWRPEHAAALDLLPHDFSCYHAVDEYSFSDRELSIDPAEIALLRRVDQVFIHSPGLLEKKGGFNPHTAWVPNGADYHAFATPVPEPADLRDIPHPRIGYVGLIKKQLDWTLLHALAERHREWQFVFVGHDKFLGNQAPLRASLGERPNVHFVGGKAAPLLPAYVQHLDVGMLCYQVNDYTKFIYPLKLHEYLAAGRPVVAAPIRTVMDFRDVVEIAATPAEWSAALARCLTPEARTRERQAARRAVARRHNWDDLVASIAQTLLERMGLKPRVSSRMASSPTD